MHESTWKLQNMMKFNNFNDKLTIILSIEYFERENDYTFMM